MIDDNDVEKLKETFATKKEFSSFSKVVISELKKMNRKLDITVKFFDGVRLNHEKRISRVEDHLGFPKFVD